jgi:hypothetical protein
MVFCSSLEGFVQADHEAGLENRLHYLDYGDTYSFEVAVEMRS